MYVTSVLRNVVAASQCLHPRARLAILRALGFRLGTRTFISPPLTLKGTELTTGPGCYFNSGVFVGAGPLTLGSGVFVGPGVMFITNSHEFGPSTKRAGTDVMQPIVVGDGVMIGARAVILGGVRIGAGCVIGAGAS